MFKDIGYTHIVLLAALIVALYRVRRSLPGSGLRAWHERHTSVRARARWHRVLALEATELALAGIFFLVGGAKLIGRPDMIALFRDIGFGQWFRYVTGTIEVAGAALLVVPMLSGASALLLGSVMIVATLIELFVLHRPPVAALACIGGHAYVAWARVSSRHRSWLHADDGVTHARVVGRHATVKARWNFGQINAGRRAHRQKYISGITPAVGRSWIGNTGTLAPIPGDCVR